MYTFEHICVVIYVYISMFRYVCFLLLIFIHSFNNYIIFIL